jgi:heme/copper-type cytochrome/quinol oxidase subunit 2
MWWYLIPILIFSAVALISYRSGKELKEDIRKDELTK